jgi:hypothetical protein
MRTPLTWLCALAALMVGRATITSAQFVTPIPIPSGADRFEIGRYQHMFDRTLPKRQRDSIEARTMPLERIAALRDTLCRRHAPEKLQQCTDAIQPARLRDSKKTSPASQAVVVIPPRFPGLHRRYDVEHYFRTTQADGRFALFSRFAANVSDDEAYVTSDIISGLVDRVIFAVNYATVLIRSDSATTESEQRAIESQTATVIRMINNGGTLTGRFQVPVHATTGPTFQHASSVYVTGGAIGPAGNVDSLNFAATAVLEFSTGLAIREIASSAGILGQLVAGGRLGYAFSDSELLRGTGDQSFPFAQFAIGLIQNGSIGLSALLTWPLDGLYEDFAPRLVVNFAAIR